MLNQLYVVNFPASMAVDVSSRPWPFVLKTCQRTLMAAWGEEHLPRLKNIAQLDPSKNHEVQATHGVEAYLYLLETICGLKSRLIAENEIVGQFKEAYQEFLNSSERETKLMLILEKLFKDAKEIRGNYLIGIGQKTYASITRKHLLAKAAGPVCIVGSGELALDLIHQLKKKREIIICARNQEKVNEWKTLHHLEILPWEKRAELARFPLIANTIGDSEILFDESFFYHWNNQHPRSEARVFVDLGHPSVVQSSLERDKGLIRLQHILQEGAIQDEQKLQQIDKAKEAMDALIERRARIFQKKLTPHYSSELVLV